MQRRLLGTTGLRLSPIGFGAWEIGGPGGAFAWESQDDRISIAAIHAAIGAGINWIDTAPVYGFGHSETVVGRALRKMADPPFVFTKCGLVWDPSGDQRADLSAASIREQLEASLRRLGSDTVDLLQIHWPAPADALETAWQTLVELKRIGLTRFIGVSNFGAAQIERVRPFGAISSAQSPYSLLAREIEDELLPYCNREHIGFLAYSPLQSGLLGGTITHERMAKLPEDDWRHRDPMFQEPYLSERLAVAEGIRRLGARRASSTAEMAVAWVLQNPAVSGAIVGFSKAEQVERIINAIAIELAPAELTAIETCLETALVSPPPPPRYKP